jgi:hypothetical protein
MISQDVGGHTVKVKNKSWNVLIQNGYALHEYNIRDRILEGYGTAT